MTHGQQQLKKLFEVLTQYDELFQYSEETTGYIGKIYKSEESTDSFLTNFKKHNIDVDEHIQDMKNDLLQWRMKFEANPVLKQSYIELGERLKTYRDRFYQPHDRAFNARIKKAGVIVPIIEPLEVKRLSYIPEDKIENYRIEVEYQFLARQAMADRKAIANLEQIKVNLRQAVACDKQIRAEYDAFLSNKLIIAHIDGYVENADVYDIPYNNLTRFIKAAEPYIG